MKKIVILSTLAGLLLTPTCVTAQKQWHIDENKKKKSETTAPPAEKKPEQQIKDYSKVIQRMPYLMMVYLPYIKLIKSTILKFRIHF